MVCLSNTRRTLQLVLPYFRSGVYFLYRFLFVVKGPAADATDLPQPWGLLCNPVMKMISSFPVFPCNEAPGGRNWQEKTEVLGEKPVPVPLFPPQIPHGLTGVLYRFVAFLGHTFKQFKLITAARDSNWFSYTASILWKFAFWCSLKHQHFLPLSARYSYLYIPPDLVVRRSIRPEHSPVEGTFLTCVVSYSTAGCEKGRRKTYKFRTVGYMKYIVLFNTVTRLMSYI
jgi:hypothetical protein